MKKRKAILLLKSFSPQEMEAFRQFLASPYYNEDEVLVRLFDVLQPHYPDFSGVGFTKAGVFRSVFAGRAYDDKALRYLLSDLTRLLEQFIAVRRIEAQPFQLRLALLEGLSEKEIHKGYRRVNRQLEAAVDTAEVSGSELFFTKMKLSEIREKHFQQQRLRRFDAGLQHFADDLDKYYFLNRLKIACGMLDQQTILQAEYHLNISPEWVKHLEANRFYDDPLIQLYYTIFQALRDEANERYFIELTAFLNRAALSIALLDLKDIYLFAINYCARKIRQGKDGYVDEALRLYRVGIEKGILLDDTGLSPWTFTNVVKLALRQRQYEWIESFINKYAPMLPEQFRENALHYNLAELYYYTDRYDRAQRHLIQVAFSSDLNYYLGARVLLAKIYYESGEEEALLSLISSFTVFLKRNKELSTPLKRTYLNFCQILFQILRRSPRRMEKLRETINDSELLTDRAWLERIYSEAL